MKEPHNGTSKPQFLEELNKHPKLKDAELVIGETPAPPAASAADAAEAEAEAEEDIRFVLTAYGS